MWRILSRMSSIASTCKDPAMTTLKAEALIREFYYAGMRIPDPGSILTVEQVRDLVKGNAS